MSGKQPRTRYRWKYLATNSDAEFDSCRCEICGVVSVMDKGVRLAICPFCSSKMIIEGEVYEAIEKRSKIPYKNHSRIPHGKGRTGLH